LKRKNLTGLKKIFFQIFEEKLFFWTAKFEFWKWWLNSSSYENKTCS